MPIESVVWEWGETFLRWVHVIAGIAWIGSSFYFIHLDLSLRKRDGVPADAYGDAWQVHGGGFYHMVKFLVAPAKMPEDLTWFKWEAYATWLSGFALLVVVYYFGAELYLVDARVLDISTPWAIAASIGFLVVGWTAYDLLCRSPLGKHTWTLIGLGFTGIVAMSWAMTLVFSPRGAFMHMGALIGTIMAANVLMVIIPGQRKVVADLLAGRAPDPIHGYRGKQRSLHNNYLTLPVVFVMIANHYPLAFATRWNWLILALLLVIGGVVRHFYNSRHQDLPSPWWTWGVAAACAAAIVALSLQGPAINDGKSAAVSGPVRFADVEEIVTSRCSMCHAAEPVWNGIIVPPKGVRLDTGAEIRRHARQIGLQAVATSAMPPANVSLMTAEERAVLAAWLANPAAVR